MKKLKIIALLWLIIAIIGTGVLGFSLLSTMSSGHLAVPITAKQLPKNSGSDPNYVPTVEEYRAACDTVARLWNLQRYMLGVHFLVLLPAVILAFISFGITQGIIKKNGKLPSA